MREVQSFKGHKKEVTAVAWHPIHEDFFVRYLNRILCEFYIYLFSGGNDGILLFWNINDSLPMYDIIGAHENTVRFRYSKFLYLWLGNKLSLASNGSHFSLWFCGPQFEILDSTVSRYLLAAYDHTQFLGDTMPKEFHIPQSYNNHYDPNDPEKKHEREIENEKKVNVSMNFFLLDFVVAILIGR